MHVSRKDKSAEFDNGDSGRIPDFFIVGAPKCGTTSLYMWLKDHPDIYMPVKEPKLFSNDIDALRHLDLKKYMALFEAVDRGALVGEASVTYLASDVALKQIKALNSSAMIIVLLRNPVDLLISWHAQCLKTGVESVTSVEQAWKLIPERREGYKIPFACPWPAQLDYQRIASIGTQMKRLINIFPRSQIYVALLDDLSRNPRQIYLDVLDFLGLPDDGRTEFTAENIRVAYRLRWVNRLVKMISEGLRPTLDTVYKHLGISGTGLLGFAERLNQVAEYDSVQLSEDFLEELRIYFESEIRSVEEVLGVPLRSWRI